MTATICISKNDPMAALEGFLTAWKDKRWEEMEKLTQLSWVAAMQTSSNSIEQLKSMFHFKPLAVEISNGKFFNNVVYMATVKLAYAPARGVRKEMAVIARVLCEESPLMPSPEGTWGVNPNSMFNEVTSGNA